MLSVSLKILNIILMCFDEKKNNHLLKNTREGTEIVLTKNAESIKNWHFFLANDETQFLRSLANSNFGCYCSRSALLV